MSEHQELLDLARHAARRAAHAIVQGAVSGATVAATKSSATDVVTETDRVAEDLIRETLLGARPNDAVLGEEGVAVAGTSGVRWILDPIDGTVNFLYGIAQYAVSIAAERDGEVVAGVVLNPATGVEYVATLDGPALRDGEPIGVRTAVPLGERLIATGFSYEAQRREVQARGLLRLLPQIRDIRRLGACSLDVCGVADGSLDGYFEEGVNLWDWAAGALVARRAGARAEAFAGATGATLLVVSPEAGFEELRVLLAECGYLDEGA